MPHLQGIERLLAIRHNAILNGDFNLWREAQIGLDRAGYVETEEAVPALYETPSPPKRPRGRPRKNPLPDDS